VSSSSSLYNDVIMDHIKNARNYRELAEANRQAEGINPLCGDTFTIYVRIENDRVRDLSFQCSCCGISMASASVMTTLMQGRTVQEARAQGREFMRLLRDPEAGQESVSDQGQAAVLSVVRESPSRVNCAVLAWHTLDAALEGRERAMLGG
jgi:nitrogen fixation protein NifU and related proteins